VAKKFCSVSVSVNHLLWHWSIYQLSFLFVFHSIHPPKKKTLFFFNFPQLELIFHCNLRLWCILGALKELQFMGAVNLVAPKVHATIYHKNSWRNSWSNGISNRIIAKGAERMWLVTFGLVSMSLDYQLRAIRSGCYHWI